MVTSALARGQRIARRREAAGYSQEELARLCACSVRTIMRLERGTNPAMTQRIRTALHKRLEIPLRDLANAGRA